MKDTIICGVILVILVFAVIRMKKRFKGGCCGSGGTTIRDKKTLTEPVVGEMTLYIDGMTCQNCAIRVENGLNRFQGVLCKVELKKGLARISYSQPVDGDVLKERVEKLGYTVTAIDQ